MIVFFDGQCSLCTKEVTRWRRAAFREPVEWFDITGKEAELVELGIDPEQALLTLHTRTADGRIRTGIDSYILLLSQLPRWRWLGVLMGLPVIKPLLGWFYDRLTILRLKREGRYPQCRSGRCHKP